MFWRGIRRAGAGILAVLPGPVRRALRAFWAWPARRRVGPALILVLPLPWYFALHALRVNDVLAGPTVTVPGVLVEVNHTSADRSPDTVVVAFRTADGREVRNRMSRYWWGSPKLGQTVQVEYARRGDDLYVQQAGFRPFDTDVWGPTAAALALTALGPGLIVWSIVRPSLEDDRPPTVPPDWRPPDSPWTHRTDGT